MKTYLLVLIAVGSIICQSNNVSRPEVSFTGDAKIEVGSFYAGLEFHHSSPMPQRISFYYPVANSIDLSRDYWKRDSSTVMSVGIDVDGEKEWIGFDYPFQVTPYSASFEKNNSDRNITISYNFCKDKPAYVFTMELKNTSASSHVYKILTDLQLSLRTSHSFKIKGKAWSEHDSLSNSLYINYDDPETGNAQIFSINVGEDQQSFSTKSVIKQLPIDNDIWWNNDSWNVNNEVIPQKDKDIPSARYLYEKELKPGESIKIIQVIGSAKKDEGKEIVKYLKDNYAKEVTALENYVLDYAGRNLITTGDSVLDRSIIWAKAVLAVNRHYIDGSIQPMPCPAEYNFYFTHDVLLTDLAAVKFDPERVKNDLEFIISHADSARIIPHAYYWKDSAYVTEYATPDNWNHFWFIITSGTYLRHSNNTAFARMLFPFMQKSLSKTMINKKGNVMYAYRPDWWDIGRNYGPRSFMTILAIKAIEEVLYYAEITGDEYPGYSELQAISSQLRNGLNTELWNDKKNYLMNYYEDGSPDDHYYIGSLLAAHYDLLDKEKITALTESASKYLLDPQLGIYTVYPMDFHKLGSYLKLVGDEAGAPHKYINGGIWPHGNAWYALALLKAGKREEAINFIKTTMTIEGIVNSPNGQPAMYEYRDSNKGNSNDYGQVDKPQFMWAAGWYLYCIYEIFGDR